MIDEKKNINDSRPMSAKNPLQRGKNKHHLRRSEYYLSEKENEQLNKLKKKKKVYNLLNSPFNKDNKIDFFLENTITSKNLFSEIKENKTRTRLPKIQPSTAGALQKPQRKVTKLGPIDAEKNIIRNNKTKEHNDSIDLTLKGKNSSNNLIGINKIKKGINCPIKEIPNKIIKNRNNNIDNNLKEDKLFVFTEQNKEKNKLNDIIFRKNSFSKNNKSIDKPNIANIKCIPKKEEKDIFIDNKENKSIKNNIINNININNNLIEEKNHNKKEINDSRNELINEINKEYEKESMDDKKENLNNNLNDNKDGDKSINSMNDKTVKFNKEVSIIDIIKDNIKQNSDVIENNVDIEINDVSALVKTKDDTQNNEDIKSIMNNSNDLNNQNKYSNYNIKQIVKSSANSNKNLSEISEHINMNLSTSKFEPMEYASSNNKANGESSSDKNCGLIQSLSNNIETDNYMHKNILYKNRNILLGKKINESARTIIYKGIDLNIGEIICVKRYIDKNNLEEYKNEVEIYELIQENENIIKYYGNKSDDDGNFLLLEYATENSLKSIIELCGGALNENIIRNYTKQILKALLFLHTNKKVAHRDIKCSNILLDKFGIIKLIDFGSGGILNKSNQKEDNYDERNNDDINKENNKCIDPDKPFHGFKGSWPWCAPEILANKFYGTKCDIWSLGCTIIEMGGIEPWNNTLNGYYQYIEVVGKSDKIPDIPKQFSYELKDFVLNCLEKDPDKRPDVNKLMNHFFITGTKFENKTVLMI